MKMSEVSKELLIAKAVKANLGNEKFLQGVSEENLKSMVSAIEDRDGKISLLRAQKQKPERNENITTVADLVKAGKVAVAKTPVEIPNNPHKEEKKGKKDDSKDKA